MFGAGNSHSMPAVFLSAFCRLTRPWMTAALSSAVRRYGTVDTTVTRPEVMLIWPRDVMPLPRYWLIVMVSVMGRTVWSASACHLFLISTAIA